MSRISRDTVVLTTKTTLCVLAMFNVGAMLGIVSPTLPDLQHHTNTSTTAISTLLVWSGLGCALGAIGGSPLFDRFDGFLCMAVTLILQAVSFTAVPFCTKLSGVSVSLALGAVFNYALFSGTFALAMQLWRGFPGMISPIIQGIDLMHAFGTAVTPMIVQPFLGDFRNTSTEKNTTRPKSTVFPLLESSSSTNLDNSTALPYIEEDHRVFLGFGMNFQTAYIIMGAFTIACALFSLIGFALREPSASHKNRGEQHDDELQLLETSGQGFSWGYHMNNNRRLFIAFISVGFLFFMVNGGRDVTMSGLLYTYVTKYLGFSPQQGTLLVFVYHMVRTFGHLVIILGSRWLLPMYVAIADIAFLVLSAVTLLFTVDIFPDSVWICTCVIALATSNIYPTTLSFVEEAVPVTGKISGVLFCGMAVGQMVFAFWTGNLLEKYGSLGVPIVLLASAMGCVLLFIPLALLAKRLKNLLGAPLIMETRVDIVPINKRLLHAKETTPLLIQGKMRGRSPSLFAEYGPRATPPAI